MIDILIIEDEIAIAELLHMNLQLVGYNPHICEDGLKAESYLELNSPDLILLDIMLPEKDGYELLKTILPKEIPVIFLTAKGSVEEKVVGLKSGADDYITKPFAMVEVIARIDAVLKRYKKHSNKFVIDDIEVRFDEHKVFLNSNEINLTAKEFELLDILIKNKNIALSRDKLLELVWGYDYMGETRTVDVHIQKLRKKLSLEKRIVTVYKIGYRLESDI